MPTKDQVLAFVRERKDYRLAARELGIPPGQAYLLATGMPADGSDSYTATELERPGVVSGSTQVLVHEPAEVVDPESHKEVRAWIKARVRADVPMQEQARSRDAAPGEVEGQEFHDIATILTRDHNQVTALFQQLKTIPGVSKGGNEVQQSRRASIVDMIAVALSKHEATEEEQFWPLVTERLEDGEVLRATALAQEQEGKDLLVKLGKLEPSEEEFDKLAEEAETASRKHVAFEDQVLLALREALSPEEQDELGRRFRRAESHAPTRPHPRAPNEPAAAVKAVGAAGAAMDSARDALGARPAKRRGKAEKEPEVRRPSDAPSEER